MVGGRVAFRITDNEVTMLVIQIRLEKMHEHAPYAVDVLIPLCSQNPVVAQRLQN